MSLLKYTDIQQGVFFKTDGTVYETVDAVFSKKSRQKGSNQVRIRNVKTGAVVTKTLHPSDTFESVSIEKKDYVFVYAKGGMLMIHPAGKASGRIEVPAGTLRGVDLVPAGTPITALFEDTAVLTVRLPIKVDLLVKEAPPGVRGNTAQGGTKRVVTETGASVTTPLFIQAGEYIRVNTETGEYVERVK